jgi:antitoxin component YwqK of YwqJK toxin-antitoxin module
MRSYFPFCLLLFLVTGAPLAQEGYNQFDENGQRHGLWQKFFEGSDQLRYQGQFEHGKEVGVFKFYCSDCKEQPMVVKDFGNGNTEARTSYYTAKGKLVSEGLMKGKQRSGEWLFYHEKGQQIMSREHYKDGVLDGKKITYYPNGTKTEELNYQQGKIQGLAYYYGPNGALLKELNYVDDELHGKALYYDANGNVVIKGNYKRGAKHGLWEYFENGNKVMEETYPKQYDDK